MHRDFRFLCAPRAAMSAVLLCLFVTAAAARQPAPAHNPPAHNPPAEMKARTASGIIASCADIPAAVAGHQIFLNWKAAREAAQNKAILDFDWKPVPVQASNGQFDPLAEQRGQPFVSQGQALHGCEFNFSNGQRLDYADFHGSDLSGSKFIDVSLVHADFGPWISGQVERDTDLHRVTFQGVDLSGANFKHAEMSGVVFEAAKLPEAGDIAEARHLGRMTYETDPTALLGLRQRFRDAGFDRQDREVNYAYHRALRQKEWRSCSLAPGVRNGSPWSCVDAASSLVIDWTCQHGLALWRPVQIGFWAWLGFALLFLLLMHHQGDSGLYLAVATGLVLEEGAIEQAPQVRATAALEALGKGRLLAWAREELRLARIASLFSLVNGFNIGFREADIGRWIHLLPGREFEFRAVGLARTLAGIQALLTLYLLSIWLLCLFGHPFG